MSNAAPKAAGPTRPNWPSMHLPPLCDQHILGHMQIPDPHSVAGDMPCNGRIPEFLPRSAALFWLIVACLCLWVCSIAEVHGSSSPERDAFSRAWQAAARGDRDEFQRLAPGLQDYLLYPYLRYEDLRYRRAEVDDREILAFLEAHEDWAFTEGLERAWLRSLASRQQWDSLLSHARDVSDTEVRCAYAEARIRAGQTEGLTPLVRSLWTVGESQPEACDSAFRWLQQDGGITPGLAWRRVQLAMEAGNPGLARYLARFLPADERLWVDRWYQQQAASYRRLDEAAQWPADRRRQEITEAGLRRLARSDADRAWRIYQLLDGQVQWSPDVRSGLLREIALWSAVSGSADATLRVRAVPDSARDDNLLEWWVRHALARGAWPEVSEAIAGMSPTTAGSSRWRYWRARALAETGAVGQATSLLEELAQETSYHGFLAADQLRLPYIVCPETPVVAAEAMNDLALQAGFRRALELRKAGVRNWARSEWGLAARGLDRQGLRVAAGLAVREEWPEMAIYALGNSGDQRWYEWRFPLDFSDLVYDRSAALDLDPAWVMGLMRSESAMAADAVSAAGARGLMQLMPATARQLANRHGQRYDGSDQLLQPEDNIRFGTTYLRELLDRFDGNPVLVSGAYNAGPHAVDRWLQERPGSEPTIWVENVPYFETRDYIPRVLAFATIYDWRLQRPVTRVSSRMPAFDSRARSGTMGAVDTTEIVCRAAG